MARPVTRAATPTPTTARSTASPRCTPTARSGPRPSGRCATRSGSRVSRSLVTRAMELAPANPSFLDMRNALLIADTAHFKGDNHNKIWSTFASRGMGFFAGSLGGDDALPAADRHSPPKTVSNGSADGHGEGQHDRCRDRRRPGHAGLPGPGRGQPDGDHRRQRQLLRRPGAGRQVRQAHRQRSRLRADLHRRHRGRERLEGRLPGHSRLGRRERWWPRWSTSTDPTTPSSAAARSTRSTPPWRPGGAASPATGNARPTSSSRSSSPSPCPRRSTSPSSRSTRARPAVTPGAPRPAPTGSRPPRTTSPGRRPRRAPSS